MTEKKLVSLERFVDKDGKYAFKWIYDEDVIPVAVEEAVKPDYKPVVVEEVKPVKRKWGKR